MTVNGKWVCLGFVYLIGTELGPLEMISNSRDL